LLGTDSFVDRVRRRYLLSQGGRGDGDQPALAHLVRSLDPQELVGVVAAMYGVGACELLKRRSAHREARRLAMYLTAVYCRYAYRLTELAALFSVSLGGLSTTRARIERALEDPGQRELRERVDQALLTIRNRSAEAPAVNS